MYKDKDRQRQASKERMRRYRERAKGVTSQGVTVEGVTPDNVIPEVYITDAIGTKHKIDYEGRCKDFNLLLSWANGNGTAYQQLLGQLAMAYHVIKRVDTNKYLGLTSPQNSQ